MQSYKQDNFMNTAKFNKATISDFKKATDVQIDNDDFEIDAEIDQSAKILYEIIEAKI